MKKTTRKGEKEERFFYEELKASLPSLAPTTNSGATFGNGDLATRELLIDVKSSEGDRLPSISGAEWRKIEKQALSLGKDFIVPVKGKTAAGVLFPLDLAKRALEALYRGSRCQDPLPPGAYRIANS